MALRRRHAAGVRRGQSLVLFALCLLVIVLMVTITLGLGIRVKEKMELQQITDASAYSNAVATARAFNAIALLNRAEVAVTVSLAANQSLISWTSLYMASLNALAQSIDETFLTGDCQPSRLAANPDCSVPCAKLTAARALIAPEYTAVYEAVYDDVGQPDEAAGAEARAMQGAAATLGGHQGDVFWRLQADFLNGQRLTGEIVRRAELGHKWPDEYVVEPAADAVSRREVGALLGGGKDVSTRAVMGTRGDPFIANRDITHGELIAFRLNEKLGFTYPLESVVVDDAGMAYWTLDDPGRHVDLGTFSSVSDDDAEVGGFLTSTLTCPVTLSPMPAEALVMSDDRPESRKDRHYWTGGQDRLDFPQYDHPHTMGYCNPGVPTPADRTCPGVWTVFLDFDPSVVTNRDAALHGQPKNLAVVRRDYTARCGDALYGGTCAGADPWNLMFRFRFTPGGERFDHRGLATTANDDLSNAVALSTGLAYYHRPEHWQEPPNLMNPFWRATLVSGAVDAQGDPERGGTDLRDSVLAAGGPSAGTAVSVIDALNGAGFVGWQ